MRTTNYDLYLDGVLASTTKNYAEAVEWAKYSDSTYKVRLDEIIPEVDPKEVKYRAENIAKKDAIRAAKRAAVK